jgi:hypothetical protein
MQVGKPRVTLSTLRFYDQPLDEPTLQRICRAAGHRGYTSEGMRFTGKTFRPRDVDRKNPLYVTEFDDPAELAQWKLEGGYEALIEDGRLILRNKPPDGQGKHLVFWLAKELPADFLLEFEFNAKDRHQGLAIVFINARGVKGESIFDPSLAPRDGTFSQYTSGDVNSYHISYWAGGRGSANVRKNSGFYLTAIGQDLVWTGEKGRPQTISIYKRGGDIRLMVDDIEAVRYQDDGQRRGPVHTHSGWIGLRQMAHADWCEYERLAVYPLK